MFRRIVEENRKLILWTAFIAGYGLLGSFWGDASRSSTFLTLQAAFLVLSLGISESVVRECKINFRIYYAAMFFVLGCLSLLGGENIRMVGGNFAVTVALLLRAVLHWALPPKPAGQSLSTP